MKVKQISIFLENKSGRLAGITKTLGDHHINIRALSIADTADFGILRLIVGDPEGAVGILKEEGLTVSETDVIAVEIPDKPGGLAEILQFIDSGKINIEYMYAFVGKSNERAVVVFRVEDVDGAIQMLQQKGVALLSAEQIYSY